MFILDMLMLFVMFFIGYWIGLETIFGPLPDSGQTFLGLSILALLPSFLLALLASTGRRHVEQHHTS